jgi:hypothetical protein
MRRAVPTALVSANCFDRLQRLVYVTAAVTVNVIEPVAVFPARSVALALNVCEPTPNEDAGPLTFAHVVDATPERASAAVHVIETCSSAS